MDTLIDIAELADDLRRVTVEVVGADELLAVSYTHLTLPTIYSV